MVDPWSSTSSYPLSFNDNEILQCPEESPEEQHLRLRVVFVPGSVEGRSEGPGDGEGETNRGEGEGGDMVGGGGRDGSGGGGGDGGGGGGGGGDGGGGGGGGGDGDGGRGNVEDGGGDRNLRPIDISKLVKMSSTVTVQTTATAVGFRISGQHSLNRVFLVCILFIDLMGYLCCMIAILLIHKNPRVAGILGRIGSIAVAFGFIVLTAMFLVGSLV
uniref:Uncharacterized protein n=1 Tax=Fagus sylvatica TaxID=28930 RepID=A0A2N9J8P4_FAGSY